MAGGPFDVEGTDGWDLTVTATYKLWAGVLSRLEYRYTNLDDGDSAGAAQEDSHGLWANFIYEF